MKYCTNCGTQLDSDARFCTKCGHEQQDFHNEQTLKREGLYDMATTKLNSFTGGKGSVHVNLRELFSDVWKAHSREESEQIFIAGTSYTTPDISDVSDEWIKPWLFSRVLSYFLLVFAMLIFAGYALGGELVIPGLMMVSAMAVPFSLVILFFEFNVFKNISIVQVVRIFALGGVLSIIVSLLLYNFYFSPNSNEISLTSGLIIGVFEESSKMIIALYFINQLKSNYILNGILIGGTVGAGFATFETAGYIFFSGNAYLLTAIVRALTAIGSHAVWTAIVGGALMFLRKPGKNISLGDIFNTQFIVFFALCILLHALWDWSLIGWFKYIVLIIVAWIILFILINAGISQVHAIKVQSNKN